MKNRNWKIRPITPHDDQRMAYIIRTVMPEFGAGGDGFAINDPEVDWMSKAYAAPRHAYFVIEHAGQVLSLEGEDVVVGLGGLRMRTPRAMTFSLNQSFDYNYRTKLNIIQTKQRKETLVSVMLSDPNASIITANSITVTNKRKWYEKPWVWGVAGITTGFLIAK